VTLIGVVSCWWIGLVPLPFGNKPAPVQPLNDEGIIHETDADWVPPPEPPPKPKPRPSENKTDARKKTPAIDSPPEIPKTYRPLDPDRVIEDRMSHLLREQGRILVRLHEGLDPKTIWDVLKQARVKAEVIGTLDNQTEFQLELEDSQVHNALSSLSRNKQVSNVCLSIVFVPTASFPEPVLSDADTKNDWGLKAIHAPEAWRRATGKGVKIAIIDSGCLLTHPDLKGRVTTSFSLKTRTDQMQVPDGGMVIDSETGKAEMGFVAEHGTHVAITAAGAANGQGTIGVAPESTLLVYQVLCRRRDGEKPTGSSEDIRDAFYKAIDAGADVINMSFGRGFSKEDAELLRKGDTGATSAAMSRARQMLQSVYQPILEKARKKNVILVQAAGNDDVLTQFDPLSSEPSVVKVAAVDQNNRRASFSNYGPFVSVSAPGVEIFSGSSNPGQPYVYLQGTSMAAPHVTGTIALMRQIKPELTAAEAIEVLRSTGAAVSSEPGKQIGPLINADAALRKIAPRSPAVAPLAEWKVAAANPASRPIAPLKVKWTPDSQKLVCAIPDGRVMLLRVDGGQKLALEKEVVFKIDHNFYALGGLAVAPNGQQCAAIFVKDADHPEGGRLVTYSLPDLKTLRESRLPQSSEMVSYSPDSTKIATYQTTASSETVSLYGDQGQIWQLWGANSGKQISQVTRRAGQLSVPVQRDGMVATFDQRRELWLTKWTDSKRAGLLLSEQEFESVRSQMMNARVGLAGFGFHFGDTRVFQSEIAISADLSVATFAHETNLFVVGCSDGKVRRKHILGAKVRSLAISPDGKNVLISTRDSKLTLFDTTSFEELIEYKWPGKPAAELSYSPDGRLAICGSEDAFIRLLPVASNTRQSASK